MTIGRLDEGGKFPHLDDANGGNHAPSPPSSLAPALAHGEGGGKIAFPLLLLLMTKGDLPPCFPVLLLLPIPPPADGTEGGTLASSESMSFIFLAIRLKNSEK